jgi:excisionase family DNA binding protein
MQQSAPDRLMTPAEVRGLLRVGRRKFAELVRDGALEATRLGSRTIRIRESAVRRLLDARVERGR